MTPPTEGMAAVLPHVGQPTVSQVCWWTSSMMGVTLCFPWQWHDLLERLPIKKYSRLTLSASHKETVAQLIDYQCDFQCELILHLLNKSRSTNIVHYCKAHWMYFIVYGCSLLSVNCVYIPAEINKCFALHGTWCSILESLSVNSP